MSNWGSSCHCQEILPGQYFDSESGLHYNYFRDYDPKTGRYIEPDPILQPNTLLTEERVFLVPIIAFYYPQMLNPYNYAVSNPMVYSDPNGLGLIDWVKCYYYGRKVAKAGEQCNAECPGKGDYEGTIRFIERYATNGSLDTALLACACEKAGPEICDKWITSCAINATGFRPGGGPKR